MCRVMNVCIFNGDMSRGGGTERITQTLANLLCESGEYSVIVLNCNNEKGNSYYPLDDRVKMATLKNGGVAAKILDLNKFLRRNKIDVIINVDIMLGIFSLPAAFFTRTKVIAWEMFNIRNDIGSKHTKLIRKLSLHLCAYYVNQTKGDMEAFQREFKVRCPITYIYNPCDANEAYTDYNSESKTILTAGHFFYTKGYDLALDVAKIVLEKHPDWTWRFVGDGSKFEELKQRAINEGLDGRVIFAGRTKDMPSEYRNASFYVMTSRTEGFGLVLTEAKSYNLPTLAFDVDFGPREIIEDAKSGYLVPAFDVEQMADRVCELIENKDKRCEFAKAAKENLSVFSAEKFKNDWIDVLTSIKK